MVNKILLVSHLKAEDGSLLGPMSFVFDMDEIYDSSDGQAVKMSLFAKTFEKVVIGKDIGVGGICQGAVIESITRLNGTDEIIETTTKCLLGLEDKYIRMNYSYTKYAADMKCSLTQLLKDLESTDVQKGEIISKLEALLDVTKEHVIDVEGEI